MLVNLVLKIAPMDRRLGSTSKLLPKCIVTEKAQRKQYRELGMLRVKGMLRNAFEGRIEETISSPFRWSIA
jgi:hypothetical protein